MRKREYRKIDKKRNLKNRHFNLANSSKKYKGCKNIYAYKSNIHNLIYKDVNFENVRYQASNITYCNFKNSKLLGVDFVNTNLKYTNFKGAKLEEVIFFNCNLKNVNFENVQFKKVFFISTNIKNAKNLNLDEGCVYINSYPNIELNTEILNAIDKLKNCSEIYKSHVLHVNKNKINLWNINLLLNYGQENLTRCMQALLRRKNKHNFYTVYSYEKYIENYLKI